MLVDNVETGVFLQHLRDVDTLGRLVVFEQGSHDSRQCQSRAVEGVAQVGLLVGTTVAALQTVGLVCVEVLNRAHLEPTVLSLAVHFEIVADGRCEAHVAATQAQNAVRQLKFLQQSFYVGKHFAVRFVAVLGGVDADNLDFREFVQSIKASHVLAVASGFAAEALGVGAVLYRQLFLVENHIAVDVGHRHFGCRDKV